MRVHRVASEIHLPGDREDFGFELTERDGIIGDERRIAWLFQGKKFRIPVAAP